MTSEPATSDSHPPAPLWRRLMAMLYDSLLCLALIFVVTAAYTGLHKLLISIGLFSDRYATMATPGGSVGHDPVLTLVLIASLWLFFGFFWRRAGQTLGMQTWRIRIENTDGSVVSWTQALLRIIAGALSWATFGLGWLWQWLDSQHRSWTDRLSGSRTVQLPKKNRKQ
ncbi:RDD family protein [Vreelandella utahensis]|uniref:RDD family protein n=1 Tax=Vreelandella halophila TaxID=86177 RepID=UPI0009855058|nr:RDD family protein [Halomonas utahensis]